MDELWAFVGKKQKRVRRAEGANVGDQYTFVALASSSRAILSYRTGKRDGDNTEELVRDLRERVLGAPEISTDGLHYYESAIRRTDTRDYCKSKRTQRTRRFEGLLCIGISLRPALAENVDYNISCSHAAIACNSRRVTQGRGI